MINNLGGPAYRPHGRRPGFWSTLRTHADKSARERVLRACESFFWNTCCCTPASSWRVFHWWYSKTGNIALYFHKKHCAYCLDVRSRPWQRS